MLDFQYKNDLSIIPTYNTKANTLHFLTPLPFNEAARRFPSHLRFTEARCSPGVVGLKWTGTVVKQRDLTSTTLWTVLN